MSVRGKILVVDDDDDTRTCVVGVLEDEGYAVRHAPNGREAMTVLNGFTPDLVLLDLMMPVMSGWEVLEEMARIPKLATLPVVVFTAAGEGIPPGTKLTKPVVRKPIEIEALLRMVNDFCAVSVGLDDPPSDLLPKQPRKGGRG